MRAIHVSVRVAPVRGASMVIMGTASIKVLHYPGKAGEVFHRLLTLRRKIRMSSVRPSRLYGYSLGTRLTKNWKHDESSVKYFVFDMSVKKRSLTLF